MSEELFPNLKHKKHHKVYGIGGTGFAGEAVECDILISSSWETRHRIKPMLIPDKENLVILGRDFLKQFGTTEFDWINQKVRIGADWIFMVSDNVENDISTVISKCIIGQNLSDYQQCQVKELLQEFCQAFVTNSKAPKLCTTEVHRILSNDDSVAKDKVRRLPNLWKGEISRQIQEMQVNGIIRPSKSPFNSNPVLVNKNDGTKRFVIDFRNLNKNTVQDSYPLPDINDLIDVCLDCNFFTQLDLASGYWCLEINEDDKKKTAFSVPNGKFEFNRMPFGLKNGQATMQRTIDQIKHEILEKTSGVDAYVDNIFIFSKTFEEHLSTLKIVFESIIKHNLSLKAEKCEIGCNELDFLGFHVAKNSVSPRLDNVQKLIDFPVPTSKKKVQAFLGLANFNRKFIPKYAELTKPLTSILSDKEKFVWTNSQQNSFENVKQILARAPALGLPDFKKPFYIQTDASDIAVGGVLFQYNDSKERVVLGYHSKTMKKSQLNWKVTEKEMYGVKVCCEKWNVYCNGKVIIRTDHEPLKFIHRHKDNRGKIVRWLLEMESIDYTIEYVKGSENEAADALSRVEIKDTDCNEELMDNHVYLENSEDSYCNIKRIQKEQKDDKVLKYVMKKLTEKRKVNKGPFRNIKGLHIQDGVLKKGCRIVIPEKIQRHIIDELHGQYHQGIENTTILIKSRFWWKKMGLQVEEFVRDCQSCASCKNQKNPKAEMVINPEVPEPRESVSMDVGSMPMSPRGMCCFLLIVDLATKFVSVAALGNQQADTLKNALWDKWFSIFGIPVKLRSDQGKNVDGNVINDLCKYLAIVKERSSPYHPEGNGLAERAIGSVKSLVSVICESRNIPVLDWDLVIYEAVLAHNTAVNKSLKYSPFMCMFGENGQLPVDNFMGIKSSISDKLDRKIVMNDAKANLFDATQQYKKQYDKTCHQNNFTIGQEVMLKRNYGPNPKIAANWTKGPYYIDKKIGPVNYSVKGPKGSCKIFHHNNLKPVLSLHEATRTAQFDMSSGPNIIHESVPIVKLPEEDNSQLLDLPVDQQLVDNVDRQRFSELVLSHHPPVVPPNLTSNHETVTRTSSGRVTKQTKFYGVIDN